MCPANPSLDLYVDAIHGHDTAVQTLHPTGVAHPAACRFKTLGKALSQVQTGGSVIALSEGATSQAPMTFRDETFPLVVPDGVTLRGAVRGQHGSYQIAYDGTVNAVDLKSNTILEGLVIFSEGGKGRLVTCAREMDQVRLRSIGLRGAPGITAGAALPCNVAVEDTDISGATACLTLAGTSLGAAIVRSSFTKCSVGMVLAGTTSVGETTVSENGDGVISRTSTGILRWVTIDSNRPSPGIKGEGRGIVVTAGYLALDDSEVSNNASAGAHVTRGSFDSTNSTIHDNGLSTASDPADQRRSGVYVENGSMLTIINSTISKNAIHGVHVAPGAALDYFHLSQSQVESNRQAGVQVDGSVVHDFAAVRAQVFGNGSGGMIFNAGVHFSDFWANQFFGNVGYQLAFMAPSRDGVYRSVGTNATPSCSIPNQVYCYSAGSPGLFAATGVAVDAGLFGWQYANATAGRDFAGPVDAHDPCAAVGAACSL